jgi:radical SAM protein with 4Fe4S-binding SPASM domain
MKKENPSLHIESLDVEITTKCNLACPYCYIGIWKLKKTPGMIGDMTDETIEQILDLIEKFGNPRPAKKQLPDGKKQDVKATHIDFYGGEGLVAFERVKYFIDRSWERGMDLTFSLLSNGTTGTKDQINWIKHHKIWTQRSIDGYPEAQEKYRPNSIKLYEEKTKLWQDYDNTRRMTVMPEFAKDLMKTVKYFESQGFTKGISPMPNYYTEWTDEHIQDFKDSLWELGRYYLKKWKEGKSFYVFYFDREIQGRFNSKQLPFGCGGARGLHCVSWDGWMYMCHRFSKDPHDSDVCYGQIKDILDGKAKGYGKNIYDQIEKHNKGTEDGWREECRNCVAKSGCMKTCMHTSFMTTKTLDTPPKLWCEIHKEAAKIVTWLDRELREIDANWWNPNKNKKTGSCNGNCSQCPLDKINLSATPNKTQQGRGCGIDMCQEFSDGKKIKLDN